MPLQRLPYGFRETHEAGDCRDVQHVSTLYVHHKELALQCDDKTAMHRFLVPVNEGEKYAHLRKQFESDTPRIDRTRRERALALAAPAAAQRGSGLPC